MAYKEQQAIAEHMHDRKKDRQFVKSLGFRTIRSKRATENPSGSLMDQFFKP